MRSLIGRRARGRSPAEPDENPNPRAVTNNWNSSPAISSGSYAKCADPNEPGIAAIHRYLAALPYPSFNGGNCEPGADYLVTNYPERAAKDDQSQQRSEPLQQHSP